jgi:MFS family permease
VIVLAGLAAPFESRSFRWLEGTATFSNIAIWILSLVSGFVMETLTRAPVLVTLATAITSFTALISVVFSGAAADTGDRRVILLVAKLVLLASAVFLAVMAVSGALSPATLLFGLAGVGLANGTSSPSWWTTVSSLVPPRSVPVALSVDSFQWNIGQVVGPIVGGFILHEAGAAVLFAVASALIVPLPVFLVIWRGRADTRLTTPGSAAAERILGSISAGWRYFLYTAELRSIAARTALFVTPSAALGALLPLIATHDFHASASTYGIYVAFGGLGALGAALVLPRLHGRLHLDVLVAVATLLNAGGTIALALAPSLWTLLPAILLSGGTWVWATTVFTIATRGAVPEWVRTRTLSIYYLVLQGPYALGGIAFGILDTFLPLHVTLAIDAALFLPGVLLIPRYGLPVIDREHQELFVRPNLSAPNVAPADGPVMVLIEYLLADADIEEFLEAIAQLRIVRRRLGATRWGIFEDVTVPGRFMETFLMPSWEDYVRQRDRYSVADHAIDASVASFHRGATPPVVTRLVHPNTVEAAKARSSWRREMARLLTDPLVE